nr:MAG TPA: hypothetical protein [Caudoviricetes sp.]
MWSMCGRDQKQILLFHIIRYQKMSPITDIAVFLQMWPI